MEFKDRLRQLRKGAYMSQTAVAQHLSYGYTAIANYESGKNQPSIETLMRLADLFSVSIDYLVGYNARIETKRDADLLKILNHYGVESQMIKVGEELGELLIELSKYLLAVRFGKDKDEIKMSLASEVADVNNMTRQIALCLGIADEVEKVEGQKVQRELRRIEEGD